MYLFILLSLIKISLWYKPQIFIIYLLFSYNKHNKFDKMLPKVVVLLLAVIIFGQSDTSIAKSLNANS